MRLWARIIAPCLLLMAGLTACSGKGPRHPIVPPEEGAVRIAVAQVNDGDAHFFTYQGGNKDIYFFARTDNTGKILTHFDACYSCYKYREGYVQEGREVVCTACQIGFKLDQEEWDWVGPCVPVTLQSKVKDGVLIITEKKLARGAKLF